MLDAHYEQQFDWCCTGIKQHKLANINFFTSEDYLHRLLAVSAECSHFSSIHDPIQNAESDFTTRLLLQQSGSQSLHESASGVTPSYVSDSVLGQRSRRSGVGRFA